MAKALLKVGFSRKWAITMVICGLFCVVLNMIYFLLIKKILPMQFVLAIVIVISGLLYWKGKYFELYDDRIRVYALVQFISKDHPYDSLQDMDINSRFVIIQQKGKVKKVRIGKLMARKSDWNKFEQLVRSADVIKELHN